MPCERIKDEGSRQRKHRHTEREYGFSLLAIFWAIGDAGMKKRRVVFDTLALSHFGISTWPLDIM